MRSPISSGSGSSELTPAASPPPPPPPLGSLSLLYKCGNINAVDSQIKPQFSIVNNGSTSVPLSELKILRFAKNDWTNYTQSNDYSFSPAKTSFTSWSNATLYRQGALVWGAVP